MLGTVSLMRTAILVNAKYGTSGFSWLVYPASIDLRLSLEAFLSNSSADHPVVVLSA